MGSPSYAETKRQIEHLIPIGFAFLLPYLTWQQALGMAFLSILYGLFGSRHLLPGTYRLQEIARGFSMGKFSYGLAVFLMILFFHDRMFVVGAAWANLSVGDSLSNILGQKWGHRPLPWNPDKSWVGSCTFFISGTVSGALLIWWIGAPTGMPRLTVLEIWSYALLAAFVAAVVESLPEVINDNLSICFSSSTVLYVATHAEWTWQLDSTGWMIAVGVNLVLGTLGYLVRTVGRSGWIGGIVIGTIIYYCVGLQGYLILLLFFVLGSMASKLGLRHKEAQGIAQKFEGRRGASNVLANCLAGVLCAIGAATTPLSPYLRLAFLGTFATATFDTLATEVGQWLGRRPILLFPLRRVSPGTKGAMSLEGTLAGLVGSLLVSAVAFGLEMVTPLQSGCIVLAAGMGSLGESLIGASDRRELPMKNEILNFTNTVIGGGLTVVWTFLFTGGFLSAT